jgi:hypothetical protein
METVAGLLRHPSPISINSFEACETFLYVFKGYCRLAGKAPVGRKALPDGGVGGLLGRRRQPIRY